MQAPVQRRGVGRALGWIRAPVRTAAWRVASTTSNPSTPRVAAITSPSNRPSRRVSSRSGCSLSVSIEWGPWVYCTGREAAGILRSAALVNKSYFRARTPMRQPLSGAVGWVERSDTHR
jgi:hypothetical protein